MATVSAGWLSQLAKAIAQRVNQLNTFTQTVTKSFHVVACYTCGGLFGINDELHNRAVVNKEGIVYCPACGLTTYWFGKSPVEKVREEMQRKLDVAKRRADGQEQRAYRAENSLRATKGVVTRMKKRAANGVCPCCHRTFKQLVRHMDRKHPGYVASVNIS